MKSIGESYMFHMKWPWYEYDMGTPTMPHFQRPLKHIVTWLAFLPVHLWLPLVVTNSSLLRMTIEIASFPVKNGVFPLLCKCLPEGKSHQIPFNHHFLMVFLWFSHGFPMFSCYDAWSTTHFCLSLLSLGRCLSLCTNLDRRRSNLVSFTRLT